MKASILFTGLLMLASLAACSNDDDPSSGKDTEPPKIIENDSTSSNPSNPTDCQVYHRGDIIYFNYEFTDNQELGNYALNVHNNFDHHNHPNMNVSCPLDPTKDPTSKVWIFNQTYPIPAGLKEYNAKAEIPIPKDIDPGDYHFMIVVTDKTGWQAPQRGISIKILP